MDDVLVGRLRAIFAAALDLSADAVDADIRRIAIDRWDSLAQVTIVAGIESEFDVSLDAGDIERVTSLDGARQLVEEKLR